MAVTRKLFTFSALLVLVLLSFNIAFSKDEVPEASNFDEDLAFLEQAEGRESGGSAHDFYDDHDFENYDDLDDFDAGEEDGSATEHVPAIDESDVVVLKGSNFSEFVEKNRFVMVEFYAPWCGHCQALAPEYASAATELKADGVVLAKVDATEESELGQKYDVQGFPTVYFFIDGVHKAYPAQRTKEAIVNWVRKKIGPVVSNVTTIDEAERVLGAESTLVLGFLDNLVGPESEELAAAAKQEDGVNFYQTSSPDVAKLFHIDPQVKRPALVLLKKEAEKISHLEGQFKKSEIAEFVNKNKLPLVTVFTRESASQIFENPIKKQLILFTTSEDSEKHLPIFQEAAKAFKGKLIFVYVQTDNEDVGKPVSEYFGVSGDAAQLLAYTGNDDARKFVLQGEPTLSNIKSFAENFLEDNLKPFYKSDPIPETNDEDVKVVVGNNFDEIVLDESKDVLLEIYAPWCGHCQALEPTYNKLAKYLKGIDSLVIAKMDGTTNEHPRAKSDGFPTLLFFPAGNKSFDPITVETDRTVVAFYKFLKKHAAIPFKLQKPASTPTSSQNSTAPDAAQTQKNSGDDIKDEL